MNFPLINNNNNNNNTVTTDKLEIVTTSTPDLTGKKIDKTLLFFGHQDRFQESLIKKMNLFGANIGECKFSNGAMLNLIIEPNDTKYNLYLSLVYTGDASANKPKEVYWVADNKNIDDYKFMFNRFNKTVGKELFNQTFNINKDITETISCYFVRHGQAYHNTLKSIYQKVFNSKINTDLVNQYNDKAIIDGGEHLATLTTTIDHIFVSDLIRTQQTAALFLQGYTAQVNRPVPEVYVLPCLHELNDGAGDGTAQLLAYYENKTNCRNKKDLDEWKKTFGSYVSTRGKKLCDEIKIPAEIPLNWDFYKKFYNYYRDDSIRIRKIFNYLTKKLSFSNKNNADNNEKINEEINADNQLCRDNHFLGLAFDIINSVNTPPTTPPTGGKPKKRTTRKSQKSRKSRESRKSKH